MVFKRQDGDVVLARFFIHGSSDQAIRFIKRKGKFYRVDDIHTYKTKYGAFNHTTEHTHVDTVTEITPDKIIELINAALNTTMNWTGEGETYEIWVNDYIRKELGV